MTPSPYDTQVRVFREPWTEHLAVLVAARSFLDRYRGVLAWEKVPDGATVQPSFYLDETGAQKLMDMLWDSGLRPSEGSGSAGALKAVQNHLADMRRIVFDSLGLEEVKEKP